MTSSPLVDKLQELHKGVERVPVELDALGHQRLLDDDRQFGVDLVDVPARRPNGGSCGQPNRNLAFMPSALPWNERVSLSGWKQPPDADQEMREINRRPALVLDPVGLAIPALQSEFWSKPSWSAACSGTGAPVRRRRR